MNIDKLLYEVSYLRTRPSQDPQVNALLDTVYEATFQLNSYLEGGYRPTNDSVKNDLLVRMRRVNRDLDYISEFTEILPENPHPILAAAKSLRYATQDLWEKQKGPEDRS